MSCTQQQAASQVSAVEKNDRLIPVLCIWGGSTANMETISNAHISLSAVNYNVSEEMQGGVPYLYTSCILMKLRLRWQLPSSITRSIDSQVWAGQRRAHTGESAVLMAHSRLQHHT